MLDKDILKKIEEIITPVIEEDGMELVNLEFVPEYGRRVLRIFIDKESGINIESCATISRKVSSLLDSDDIIPGTYSLEVSSPGLDRALVKESDYKRFTDKLIKVKTSQALGGQKNFIGYIRDCRDQKITLEEKDSGKKFEIGLAVISKAKLEIEV